MDTKILFYLFIGSHLHECECYYLNKKKTLSQFEVSNGHMLHNKDNCFKIKRIFQIYFPKKNLTNTFE